MRFWCKYVTGLINQIFLKQIYLPEQVGVDFLASEIRADIFIKNVMFELFK